MKADVLFGELESDSEFFSLIGLFPTVAGGLLVQRPWSIRLTYPFRLRYVLKSFEGTSQGIWLKSAVIPSIEVIVSNGDGVVVKQ